MRNGSISVTPLRPVGDVHRLRKVVEEDPDDFAESQCHDREIVSTQFQGRCAEQDAEHAGNRGADRQDRSRTEGAGRSAAKPAARSNRRRPRKKRCSRGQAARQIRPRCSGPAKAARNRMARLVMRTHAVPTEASTNGSTSSDAVMQRETDPAPRAGGVRRRSIQPAKLQKSHARSPTRSPSNPDGRNTSTAISTRKAKTSW